MQNLTTPNQYFDYFNETGCNISDGEVTIYNADLMNHLEINATSSRRSKLTKHHKKAI